ncbi:MAG: 4Fe-4S binding protein [Candidatus Thermoplasmatota archaeon]
MVLRKIIEIDEEKCDGCGQCALACAEGALRIVDGKAKVVSDVFCDGLGACIGECPQGALRIVERDAPEFDEEAVKRHLHGGEEHVAEHAATEPCGCPSSNPMILRAGQGMPRAPAQPQADAGTLPPELTNWPVQWRLVHPSMPFFKGADVLLAADCVPFAYRDFHGRFLRGRPVIIGCPKLDEQQAYLDKLTALFRDASPRSLTVVMMEVPCCQGLMRLTMEALRRSGKDIPVRRYVVSIEGKVLVEE